MILLEYGIPYPYYIPIISTIWDIHNPMAIQPRLYQLPHSSLKPSGVQQRLV
jgi:hypothetical protein